MGLLAAIGWSPFISPIEPNARRDRPHRLVACGTLAIALIAATFAREAEAQPQVLETSALRLEVDAPGYSYRLIDKLTGATLLDQSQTTFTVSGTERAVVSAALSAATPDSLSFNLNLAGGSTAGAVFSFDRPDVLEVNLTSASATQTREAFLDHGEHYYGLLEYPFAGAIDNRGLNREMIGYEHAAGTNYANARAPFYVTDAGYGIYTETTALGRYQVAVGGQTRVQFDEPDMTYYIMAGSPKKVLQSYAEVAGAPFLPPDWALGTCVWRDDHHNDLGGGVSNAQALALRDAAMLEQHQIHAASMWIDRPWTTGTSGWGGVDSQGTFIWDDEGSTGNGFPDPDALISTLNNTYGLELMLWVANRTDFDSRWLDNAPAGVRTFAESFDMRDPVAVAWVKQSIGTLVNRGIRGFKIDRGEEGEHPDSVQNLNTLLFTNTIAETFTDNGVNEAYPFARSAYDTARQTIGVWNGDTSATFAGLQVSLKNMLRSAAINFPTWGSDTGGYAGTPSKVLFARWLGASAYSPIMEILVGPNRTIWDDYDQQLIDITSQHAETHQQLIPYVRSYLYQATSKGLGVVRPMVFEDPRDPNVKDMWDQYMYGDALLVAPVVTSSSSRSVYLPPGSEWLDYNDKSTVYAGGQTLTLSNVPLNEVPVFVRRGSIVVRGDILQGNNTWTANWEPSLEVEFFLTAGDSARAFEYYTGSGVATIQYAKSAGNVAASFDDLGADGVAQFYLDELNGTLAGAGLLNVTRNGAILSDSDYQFDQATNRLQISYTGATDFSLSPSGGLLVLNIDRATGVGQLENIGAAGVEIDGYRILSARGSLSVDQWYGLEDRAVEGWEEANPSANMIAELNSSGSSIFEAGAGVGLGAVYAPNHSAFGQSDGEDLIFEYTTVDDLVIRSLIRYTGTSLQPSNLLLTVDPTTGETRLTNTSQFDVAIDGYRVRSNAGSLDSSGWSSLEDQSVGDWQEANPSPQQLVELEESGSLVLNPGDSYSLGSLYSPGTARDLAIDFVLPGTNDSTEGVVVYVLAGDYNRDGTVDAADYIVWRKNLGQAAAAGTSADGDFNGTIDHEDYEVWKSHFGTTLPTPISALSASNILPEPSAGCMGCLAFLLVGVCRRKVVAPHANLLGRPCSW